MKNRISHRAATLALASLAACSYSSTTTSSSTGASVSTISSAPMQDITKPPALGTPRSLTMPAIVTRELPNGLRIVVVEHHELPLADFALIVRTGGEADEPGKIGTATLTAALLREGTTARSSLDIADQEGFLGVSLFSSAGWESSTVSLHTPTAQLDSALALFADVALHPRFPDNEIERLRRERLTSLLQIRDRGPTIADRVYATVLYGAQHPYGRPLNGDEASTQAIIRSDIQRFYDTHYRPNNATLLAVGDVTPDDIERRARVLFGSWERKTVAAVAYPTPPASGKTTIYLVDKPGAAQSSFRIGSVGVPRATPDYFPLQVANTILGGAFTSRLNNNLRETKGFTYGASSSFAMRRAPGPFTARAEIVAAKSDSALLEFMKELKAIRAPVPETELDKAKRYLQNQLPGAFETTGGIAGQLQSLLVYGLPLDFHASFVPRIGAVTQSDVQRVMSTYVDPEKLAIVIVGDRKSIEPGLRAAGVGEIVPLGIDGKPAN